MPRTLPPSFPSPPPTLGASSLLSPLLRASPHLGDAGSFRSAAPTPSPSRDSPGSRAAGALMLVSGESPTWLESPRQETLLDRALAGEGQRRQRRRPREHGRSRLTLGYRGHAPGPGPQLQGGDMWAPLESPDRTQSVLPAAAGVVAASPPACDAVAKLSGADSRHFGTERAAAAFSDDEEGARSPRRGQSAPRQVVRQLDLWSRTVLVRRDVTGRRRRCRVQLRVGRRSGGRS
eukprot:COSAG01_NODE_19708_length_994_cov_1.486034_1_plen_234_part_00